MQAATATQPATPATAQAAPGPPVSITVANPDGTTQTLAIPMTRAELRDLKGRRSELSSQLTSVAGRRRRLVEQLNTMPDGQARIGLEQRMLVLDKRMVQLESDLAATGRLLTAAPPGVITSTSVPMEQIAENLIPIFSVFTIFVMFPIAIAFARNLWKRGSRPPAPVMQLPQEATQRLERLEQGMEAIAIEIERVSEGQRFVTRLLSEERAAERIPEKVASS